MLIKIYVFNVYCATKADVSVADISRILYVTATTNIV